MAKMTIDWDDIFGDSARGFVPEMHANPCILCGRKIAKHFNDEPFRLICRACDQQYAGNNSHRMRTVHLSWGDRTNIANCVVAYRAFKGELSHAKRQK